ncbi:MAG: PfkB family carbohydrate kinase, partial [Allorhizobium sp.]
KRRRPSASKSARSEIPVRIPNLRFAPEIQIHRRLKSKRSHAQWGGVLFEILDVASTGGSIREFQPTEDMLGRAAVYAGRTANRRWFIATLHHRGAIGFDLVAKRGWVALVDNIDGVKNTSGAGDTFRGALMHALLHERMNDASSLPAAMSFATAVATERCLHFWFQKALDAIGTKFGSAYPLFRAEAERISSSGTT